MEYFCHVSAGAPIWYLKLIFACISINLPYIQPCVEYCCHVWAGAPSCHLKLLDLWHEKRPEAFYKLTLEHKNGGMTVFGKTPELYVYLLTFATIT